MSCHLHRAGNSHYTGQSEALLSAGSAAGQSALAGDVMAEILEQRCSSLDNSLPFCSLYASKAAVAMKSSSCSVQVRIVAWKG